MRVSAASRRLTPPQIEIYQRDFARSDAANACDTCPVRVPEAMTIGATNRWDEISWFSSYGPCIDWFSPGSAITYAANTGDNDSEEMSGTSMAAPHTAGAVALYLQSHPDAALVAAQAGDPCGTTQA